MRRGYATGCDWLQLASVPLREAVGQRDGDFSPCDSLPDELCFSLRDDDLPPPDCEVPPLLAPDEEPASSPPFWQAARVDAMNTGMASNAIQRW